MKKLIIFSFVLFSTITSFAQNEKYVAAMKKNIAQIDSAFAKPDLFISLANNFERIGTSEKKEWLAYYYAAYCKINFAFMQKDMSKGDEYADQAEKMLNKADSLMPNNSEISCTKSMVATLRMLVNPQQRFMKYGAESEKALQTAIKQDATNPRPHMLKGQSLKGTPEQFGGGCANAKKHLDKAIELYATFKPASDIAPNWGKSYTVGMAKECEVKK
jgi:hypothetical protein